MNRTFQQSYHIPGALTADLNIRFTAHTNMTLLHISAVASNDSEATLKIGTSSQRFRNREFTDRESFEDTQPAAAVRLCSPGE